MPRIYGANLCPLKHKLQSCRLEHDLARYRFVAFKHMIPRISYNTGWIGKAGIGQPVGIGMLLVLHYSIEYNIESLVVSSTAVSHPRFFIVICCLHFANRSCQEMNG